MYRSDLHPLYPGVDRSGTAPSPPCAVPMDVGVQPPSGVPAAAASPRAAAATTLAKCAAFGCDDPPSGDWTGRCEPHSEAWRDLVRDLTDDIGRGVRA